MQHIPSVDGDDNANRVKLHGALRIMRIIINRVRLAQELYVIINATLQSLVGRNFITIMANFDDGVET